MDTNNQDSYRQVYAVDLVNMDNNGVLHGLARKIKGQANIQGCSDVAVSINKRAMSLTVTGTLDVERLGTIVKRYLVNCSDRKDCVRYRIRQFN